MQVDDAEMDDSQFSLPLELDISAAISSPEPQRPFHLASLGGTFNTFHDGHREYLALALRLAEEIHVFIASDSYAKKRKDYEPRRSDSRRERLEKFIQSIGCAHRVELETLKQVSDIQDYAVSCKRLDLVIAERAYFAWFDEWNEQRKVTGLEEYNILCKARTRILGKEVSSSMWTRRAHGGTRGEDAPSLFDIHSE